MKLCKYYSLDECQKSEIIFEKLNELQDDAKIEYTFIKSDDIIKLKNIGLNLKEKKDLLIFLKDNDVIDYPDYEEFYEDDEFEEDEEDEENDDY
jgi:hypothetical protein